MRGSATNGSLIRDRVAVLGVDDQSLFLDVAPEVVAATPASTGSAGRHPVPKRLTP
jgi:hypothetical protein